MLEKRNFYIQEKPIDLQITPAILVLQKNKLTIPIWEAKKYAKVKYECESPVK